jgi:hypothetical protein
MAKERHDLYARIPEELFQQVKALAALHKRSVTAEAEMALEVYVRTHAAELEQANGAAPEPSPKRSPGRPKKGGG